MKFQRVCVALAFVLLLVPLAGCVGEEEPEPKPIVDDEGTTIDKGIPPKTFSFEPTGSDLKGIAKKEKEVREAGLLPGQPKPLGSTTTWWRFSWNVTGLQEIEPAAEGGALEVFYTAWVASKDDSKEEGVTWERVVDSEGRAPGGVFSGVTDWKGYYKDYLGVMISVETEKNSQPEIVLMQVKDFVKEEEAEKELEHMRPFKGAFADATVEVDKAGKVNLTVTASTLPETPGEYDVFLKNDAGNHYLGTLKFDATLAAFTFSAQPDPALFTKYQFFISIEDKTNKETFGGLAMLVGKFASK